MALWTNNILLKSLWLYQNLGARILGMEGGDIGGLATGTISLNKRSRYCTEYSQIQKVSINQ